MAALEQANEELDAEDARENGSNVGKGKKGDKDVEGGKG